MSPDQGPRPTALGRFLSFVLVLGLIGLGLWMVRDRLPLEQLGLGGLVSSSKSGPDAAPGDDAKSDDEAAGKARVAKDIVDMDAVNEKENERRALEQGALAEFLASKGIAAAAPGGAQAAPVAAPAAKDMGPGGGEK